MNPTAIRVSMLVGLIIILFFAVTSRKADQPPAAQESQSVIASELCPPNVTSQAAAESMALLIAANTGFSNATVIESTLLTGEELLVLRHVEPESPSTCYWYIVMTGANTTSRRPVLPPSVTPPPTPAYTKLHVALHAVSLDMRHSSLRGAIVGTPFVPTAGPSPTSLPTSTPRPLPTLPDW